MPSIRNYLLTWFMWFTTKATWQSPAAFDKKIAAARRKKASCAPPEQMNKQFIIEEETRRQGGYVVYTVAPKSETPTQARVMYLHGGAFVFDIVPQHWQLVAQLAERLQAVVTVPMYPLGPETQLMAVYDVLQPLYDEMASDPDPTPFWCMGDSAGGTMTLVMTQNALRDGKPTAERLVPITPCVDISLANEELLAMASKDPWLDVPGILHITELICAEVHVKDPRVSPIYGDLRGPPMMMLAGGNDLLGPDIRKMAGMAAERGTEVELLVGEGMMHVWPLLPIPEAAKAVDRIVEWLQKAK